MNTMQPTPYQAAQRPRPVAEKSQLARSSGSQRNRVPGALNAHGRTDDIAFAHPVVALQRRIAGKNQRAGGPVNQPVENWPSVFQIKKNSAGPEILRMDRANAHGFAVTDCRGHARAEGFKTNWNALPQEINHRSGGIHRTYFFWMESLRHPDHFYTGKAQKR